MNWFGLILGIICIALAIWGFLINVEFLYNYIICGISFALLAVGLQLTLEGGLGG